MSTDRKILVVYFSHSGNTRAIANRMHELAGGDIFELQPSDPYPPEYNAAVQKAKEELSADYRPKLKAKPGSLAAYDLIFVGSPNWWGTIAGPVRTFLADYDLAGKTVAPFITHEGSGLGNSVSDISRRCPRATIEEGLAIRGSVVRSAGDGVAEWLRKIKASR